MRDLGTITQITINTNYINLVVLRMHLKLCHLSKPLRIQCFGWCEASSSWGPAGEGPQCVSQVGIRLALIMNTWDASLKHGWWAGRQTICDSARSCKIRSVLLFQSLATDESNMSRYHGHRSRWNCNTDGGLNAGFALMSDSTSDGQEPLRIRWHL